MKNSPSVKKILYASDLGKNTRPVFRFALSVAEKYNAEVFFLHVVEPMGSTAEAVISTYLSETLAAELKKNGMLEMNDLIKKRIKKFCADECLSEKENPSAVTEIIIANGKPSEEVLRVAEDQNVDMIVMGKSTRKVKGAKVTGSCARRVNRHAQVPVLIIPNY